MNHRISDLRDKLVPDTRPHLKFGMPGYLIVMICGAIYLTGFMLSLSGYRLSGSVVALIGLLLLLLHYGISPSRNLSLAPFKRWRKWAFLPVIASVVLIKLEHEILAGWGAGLAIYSYVCLCLKHQVAYHSGELRFESMGKVKRKDSPLRYWLFVTLLSTLSLLLLIIPALAIV